MAENLQHTDLQHTDGGHSVSLAHSYPRGMTILDAKLFVARHKTAQIDVYSVVEPFESYQPFQVPALNWPRSMAGCQQRNRLYITDWSGWSNGVVLWMSTTGTYGIFTHLAGEPMGVSVSPVKQQVIVTVFEGGVRGENKLRVYSADGAEVSSVTLTLNRPWHAVQLRNHDFLISHGRPLIRDQLHRVVHLDVSECTKQEKNVYGDKNGSGPNQLNRPLELCVTRDGKVLVVDFGNHRIHLLAADLTFKCHVISESIEYPRRVCYDSVDRCLIVGQDNGDLKLFKWTG